MLSLSTRANAQSIPSFKYTDMGSSSEDLETKARKLVMGALMLTKAQPVVPMLTFVRQSCYAGVI